MSTRSDYNLECSGGRMGNNRAVIKKGERKEGKEKGENKVRTI